MAKEKITLKIGDEIVELKGIELEAFLEQREKDQAEEQTRKELRESQRALKVSAYTKLGLTEEEINAIL